jgi:NADPH-dependent 2,4-dienoyl-CoA reductase/sulfur reductase-like enzyme
VPEGQANTPFSLSALAADGAPFTVQARALILCCGTHERIIPFPGWTLPGVIGLAAATILLKAQGVLPGRRVVVAGAGPLLYAVAAKLLTGGASVAAVVDAATQVEWLRALPALAARADLLAQGAVWRAKLFAARVPILAGAQVTAAEGDNALKRVRVGERIIEADALCIGHGLVPATEATRTYRALHVHRPEDGGWVPVLDSYQRTSVPLLYAAGDGAGVRGAAAAPAAGCGADRASGSRHPCRRPRKAEHRKRRPCTCAARWCSHGAHDGAAPCHDRSHPTRDDHLPL